MVHSLRARRRLMVALVLSMAGAVTAFLCSAQVAPAEPRLSYEKSKASDPIALLQKQIDDGSISLAYDKRHGYLPALLKVLKVPESSQSLVFSKTSFQRESIAPWQPRALYFNTDIYIGWVQSNRMLEIASVDKDLGTIFYTLDQHEVPKDRKSVV